ncbi:MAG TPA: thiopeptide-type bacteriocin biosynthesis protein [Pseudonocardiaceae bacterium]|nr:thiopeptide-type bacteriocin biosynthesis protein [Pseudonocardiaceae bacterium]
MDLSDAIETYQNGGRAALEAQATARDWYQVHIEWPDWTTAEHTAAHELGPRLQQLQASGIVDGWWFIRKAPCWRLRLKPGQGATPDDLQAASSAVLDHLLSNALISRWRRTMYEPETVAFGGAQGMEIAHSLFCADSANILTYASQPKPDIGRRELSILLCNALFDGASQEWFERGDIWDRVTQMRPAPRDAPTGRLVSLAASIRTLLAFNLQPENPLSDADNALIAYTDWASAFCQAGQAIAAAAGEGTLIHGIRDTLRHHVIFHWNRLGLPASTQSNLAHAARTAVFSSSSSNHSR